MKKYFLLASKDGCIIVKKEKKILNTHFGRIDLSKIKIGRKVKSHLGKEFIVLKPSLRDFLEKIAKRGAQVILPKDMALILAYTTPKPDSLILDAGTGSAFAAIYLANFIPKGKVVSYEIDERFFKLAKENLKEIGLKNVVLKRKDATKGFDEKNADLIILDLKDVIKVIPHAFESLKSGGYLIIYCPTVDELLSVCKELEKYSFFERKIVENIVREWQFRKTLRPKTMGLMHTGFIVIARKLS